MDLSERKKKILSAVIETNIKNKNATAVSSKQLQEDYLPMLSSATIRNELNALEEMGYLTHLQAVSQQKRDMKSISMSSCVKKDFLQKKEMSFNQTSLTNLWTFVT